MSVGVYTYIYVHKGAHIFICVCLLFFSYLVGYLNNLSEDES